MHTWSTLVVWTHNSFNLHRVHIPNQFSILTTYAKPELNSNYQHTCVGILRSLRQLVNNTSAFTPTDSILKNYGYVCVWDSGDVERCQLDSRSYNTDVLNTNSSQIKYDLFQSGRLFVAKFGFKPSSQSRITVFLNGSRFTSVSTCISQRIAYRDDISKPVKLWKEKLDHQKLDIEGEATRRCEACWSTEK